MQDSITIRRNLLCGHIDRRSFYRLLRSWEEPGIRFRMPCYRVEEDILRESVPALGLLEEELQNEYLFIVLAF